MTKTIKVTKSFKKDFKRTQKQKKKIDKIKDVFFVWKKDWKFHKNILPFN